MGIKVEFTEGKHAGTVFEIDPITPRLTNVEAIAIERVTGLDLGDFAERQQHGSVLASTALVWVLCKRQEPTLRFDDVTFDLEAFLDDVTAAAEAAKEDPDPTSAESD